MSNDEIEIIGKNVKDMYGTFIGKVVGTITDIDGSIQTVGIDCGSEGLKQIPFEQLVVQGDAVIFIPKWRLDSQRLLREKGLTLRRLKALMDIVSENDDMKEDAEIIHEKYKSKLLTLDETEKEIKAVLDKRMCELDAQMKSVKTIVFDAKVQYKSNEISESTFESVKTHTTDLVEHITHETAEISNVQRRIADMNMEVDQIEHPKQQLQEAAVSYLGSTQTESEVQAKLPEAPQESVSAIPEPAPDAPEPATTQAVFADPEPEPEHTETILPIPEASSDEKPEDKSDKPDWLARMEAQ